jgi:hypothetical protein
VPTADRSVISWGGHEDRALATEKAASWLSKHFTYWWLEQNNHDRTLIDTDGL